MKRCRFRVISILRKEFIQIIRDPRSLIITLALPVMLLIIYGYGISMDIKNIPFGVVDWSNSEQSRDYIEKISHSGYFNEVLSSDSYAEIERGLDSGKIRLGIIIPPDFADEIANKQMPKVQILIDGTDPNTAQVAMSYIDGLGLSYTIDRMRSADTFMPNGIPPIELRSRVLYNEDLVSVNYIIPGLIPVILMATAALLTSGALARERERGTFELLASSPLKSWELMLGKIGAYTLISLADVLLVVLIGTLWFGVPLRGSIVLLGVTSLIFLMSSLGIGLLISALIPSQQTAMLLALLVTMMPSVLLSGFVFSISNMPPIIQTVTYLVPARYFMTVTRGIFLKGAGIETLWPQILAMAVFGFILLTLSVFAFKKKL